MKTLFIFKFDNKGKARIIIQKNDDGKEYSGAYSVGFLRETAVDNITLARITISGSNKEIILSRVSFGLHNAFPEDSGLFLSIEDPPFGPLKKLNKVSA